MKINSLSPAFTSNYAVLIKNSERYKANNFAEASKTFIDENKALSRNMLKATVVDLPNYPQSTMFIFSLPNHLNNRFEEMAKDAKVKVVDLDRLV